MQDLQPVGIYPEDEVRLIDLWRLLVRRKAWVIASFLGCIAVGGGYLVVTPPVYEARAKIGIGRVADLGVLEEPDRIVADLLENHGELLAPGVKRALPHLKSAVIGKAAGSVLELVAVGSTAQESHDFVARLADELVKRHKRIYDGFAGPVDERMRQLVQQKAALTIQQDQFGELMERLARVDMVQASLMALERSRIATQMGEIDGDLFEISKKRIPPATQPTELIAEPVQADRPAHPKPLFVLALSGATGLILGTLIALGVDILLRSNAADRR